MPRLQGFDSFQHTSRRVRTTLSVDRVAARKRVDLAMMVGIFVSAVNEGLIDDIDIKGFFQTNLHENLINTVNI